LHAPGPWLWAALKFSNVGTFSSFLMHVKQHKIQTFFITDSKKAARKAIFDFHEDVLLRIKSHYLT